MRILSDLYIAKAEKAMGEKYNNFRNNTHIIIGTENKKGFVGVELYSDLCWITFMYGDGALSTHKELAGIGIWLYEFYTLGQSKPIYYGNKNKNMFSKNSVQIANGIWRFMPTRLCYNKH